MFSISIFYCLYFTTKECFKWNLIFKVELFSKERLRRYVICYMFMMAATSGENFKCVHYGKF